MTSTPTPDAWIYDSNTGLYYQTSSNTYAAPDPTTGQWAYYPAAHFTYTEASTSTSTTAASRQQAGREDGEVEDDVGWGGLMEPDQLDAALKSKPKLRGKGTETGLTRQQSNQIAEKHPAYQLDDPTLYAYPSAKDEDEPPPPKETPNHILRLVVTRSEVLSVGQIAVVDAREVGVQIGRDRCEKGGSARLRVKEMEVSKTHAVVYWGKGKGEEEGWFVVDLGSTHGTFINTPETPSAEAVRLSESKDSSLPHPLEHLSTLKIGHTIFTAHIHPSWPCDACQLKGDNEIRLDDGTASVPISKAEDANSEEPPVRWAMDSKERRENREIKRKREMKALRESLLNGHTAPTPAPAVESTDRQYQDRAAMRRRLHPPSPPPPTSSRETTPPAPAPIIQDSGEAPTPVSKFGQAMLANQGWIPGSGLGRNGDGRAEPVQVEMRNEKRGLGADGSKAVVDVGEGDWRQRGKHRRYEEYGKSG